MVVQSEIQRFFIVEDKENKLYNSNKALANKHRKSTQICVQKSAQYKYSCYVKRG